MTGLAGDVGVIRRSALDAYRGYTGQSRSGQPTHTWNTARVGVVDHGGILADQRDGAEQVADALARQPDPSLAARSDPWVSIANSANYKGERCYFDKIMPG